MFKNSSNDSLFSFQFSPDVENKKTAFLIFSDFNIMKASSSERTPTIFSIFSKAFSTFSKFVFIFLSEVVLKLSHFLDYMLYDCNVSQISLEKEIEQMQNLITLEKLRYGDRLDVDFNISGLVKDLKIPPLLMLPFLENAFKHGVSQHTDNSFIYVDLKVKEQNLTFRVENSSINSESDLEADYTKGIGLKNVKRRLDLIYGDDGYNLEVFKEEDSFTIVLKISLISSNE